MLFSVSRTKPELGKNSRACRTSQRFIYIYKGKSQCSREQKKRLSAPSRSRTEDYAPVPVKEMKLREVYMA